ncbi:NACHT domain-containing and WD repeat-containing 1 [Solea senegalensis]|uniref:NACHT domain-containing and WD repeat-containing 1 n=1 Tax=Solea senegalensis TaxID=28829 RepID=A0AAV6SAF8_SOLSE|nr:NACHT domain- and WD repeat-containing protein 1 [Solea senegalensis]KAG7513905.1 NACHT domain-containing and WD repeat-containing 1 [Solea senegalensis]
MAEHLQDVLRGHAHGAEMMKTSSNMIRVFISSTFTDMSSERKALLEKAYPEVQSFCRSLGLVFEVVDLRWGIRNITSGDHKSCDIFLQEMEKCKRISAGPSFAALLGNRYGHRALPRLIPEKQFEVLMSKLSKDPEGIKQLNQWFLKDNNAVPPTYVLQPITAHFPHYSDLRPESRPQHDNNVLSWRFTETQLLQLLRSAATTAEGEGDITAEQKQHFFSSVTEWEIEQGLWNDDSENSALLFIREIPRQRLRDGPKRFARFMDVTADGLLDAEAQGLLTDLKSRLYTASKKILNLHCVELSKGSVDPKRKEHAQYLDSVCEQFVSQMEARITAVVDSPGEGRRRKIWGSTEVTEQTSDWVIEEVRQHIAMTAELSKGLHGRENILGKLCLAMWESTNVRHGPLVVHGAAGMGKTALLCKLAQEMQKVLEARSLVVIRVLSARHPQRPDIDHVLHSICIQVCLACGLSPPSPLTAGTHVELLKFFRNILTQVSQHGNTLLLILDALDQLSDQHHAHRLHWLPLDLPPNIHLVVSMDSSSEVFANMQLKVETLESFFEVERLSREEGKHIVESNMRAWERTLTPEQSNAVLQSFESTGCPLHLKLILYAAKQWTSFTPPTELHLGASKKEMMTQLFVTLEEKHGKALVAGALGYLALAREGLLEAELRDVMSLDDDVISEVYRYSLPPTPSLIRLPPFLWARLRRDLEDMLEERWTAGLVFIAFNNRHLVEEVSSRYLTSERRGQSHRIMAEYFLGRWSGKLKPAALPGLSLLLSDRKVPPQPLWFSPGLANVRKLIELPYHLLHAGLWEELRLEVIGNAEWLYCKSRVCGVSSVIQDLDQSSQYMDCTETRLLRDTLVLIKPSLDFLDNHMDMSLFYTELMARLCSLAPPFPALIGRLCTQCEEWLLTCPEPILVTKCSFLQQPGGALQHTLSGLEGGVLCLDVSLEAELLVAGSDEGVVAVWSLVDQQLVHTLLGHTGSVLLVKVTDSSSSCLSLAADGCLRRWSLINGQELLCIQEAVPADSSPLSVHLCDQKQLLWVHSSSQVNVWNLSGCELLSSSMSQKASVFLGVLDDSIFSLSDSGLVTVSHPVSKAPAVEVRLENSQTSLTPVKFVVSPKWGKMIVATTEGFLYQISRSGGISAVEFPLVPSLLSVTEDEKILIAAAERTLSLFNLDRDAVDKFLDLQHEDTVLSACMSSDGRTLASGAADQLIRMWSVTTGALLDTLCGSDAPVTSVLLYKGFVVSASAAAASVHVWSLKYDGQHKPTARVPSGCAHVAITKDAERVFFVRHPSQTEVISWNNSKGSVCDRLAVSAEVCCLELAQQKRLLLCGLTTGTVLIYPLALPQETLCIPPSESLSRVLSLAVSSQEKHVAVAYEDSVCLFEITARDSFPSVDGPLQRFPLSLLHAPLSSMALLSDRRLLYGTSCGEVRLYDFSSGRNSDLEPHRSRVTCVTVSNWGKHALVGSEDAVQRLWALNPPTLDHIMEYKGFFFEGVLCAAFSDSDQFVFTGSQDRTVKVWDVAKGNLLYVQYVYSPVVRMVTYRNGFLALSRHGAVIREVFRCPEHVSADYNPLRNVKAQYRVTSREKSGDKSGDNQETMSACDLQDFNPAQFNLNLINMMRDKPSPTCTVL